jgi:hypothetical protein
LDLTSYDRAVARGWVIISGNFFLALGAVLVRLPFIFANRERKRRDEEKRKEELSLPSSVCIASLSMTTPVEFFTNERSCRGCSFDV